MNTSKIILVLAGAILAGIYGCKKNEFRPDEYTNGAGKAQLKVVCFSPDSTSPSAQIYINGALVSPNVNFTNEPYPGGGYNTGGSTYNGYLAVDPGNAIFKFVQATTYNSIITKDLFSISLPVEANVKQIVYVTDTGVNRTAFNVKCQTDRPDSGSVKIQFVNCMPNTTNVPVSFVFNVNGKDTLIAHRLKFKEVKDFVTLPLFASPILKIFPSDSLFVGKSVSGKDSVYAPPASILGTAYTFAGMSNRKVYTCTSRGFYKSSNSVAMPKVSLVIIQ
ncbi:DUF4397 domain-containing protein [Chitinophagaceae bacterium LWZ2-11]